MCLTKIEGLVRIVTFSVKADDGNHYYRYAPHCWEKVGRDETKADALTWDEHDKLEETFQKYIKDNNISEE